MPDKPRFAYALNPMDFGWDGFPTVSEYLRTVLNAQDGSGGLNAVRSFLAFYDEALELGASIGWEADLGASHDTRVALFPDSYLPRLALIWRDAGNGITFVVSEVRLAWLQDGDGQADGPPPGA